MAITTPELLDRLLSGEKPTEGLVDDLLRQRLREDHLLDYKVGDWLRCTDTQEKVGKPTKAADRLKAWVTGFANGDGGVLIIGVADDDAADEDIEPWSVTGCSVPVKGKQTWEQWVTDCLRGVAHLLVPTPVVEVVGHREGDVLVVAVHRAPNLVPVTDKKGGLGHFLRFGDGTHWIPPFLHADLVLGRRKRPVFSVSDSSAIRPDGIEVAWAALRPQVEVHNVGLVWAESPRIVWVGVVQGEGPGVLPATLQPYFDIAECPQGCTLQHLGPTGLSRPIHTPDKLEPFAQRPWGSTSEYRVPIPHRRVRWLGGLLVFAEGCPPSMFQIEVDLEKLPKLCDPWIHHAIDVRPVQAGRIQVGVHNAEGA